MCEEVSSDTTWEFISSTKPCLPIAKKKKTTPQRHRRILGVRHDQFSTHRGNWIWESKQPEFQNEAHPLVLVSRSQSLPETSRNVMPVHSQYNEDECLNNFNKIPVHRQFSESNVSTIPPTSTNCGDNIANYLLPPENIPNNIIQSPQQVPDHFSVDTQYTEPTYANPPPPDNFPCGNTTRTLPSWDQKSLFCDVQFSSEIHSSGSTRYHTP